MEIPESARRFWDAFQASVPYDASPRFHEAFHFDDNEPSADALGALVLSGLTDWGGTPLCVIETTHVEIVPFDRVDEGFAATEGEGDGTLRYWRDAHWRFFSRECARIGRQPDLSMPVVCERFEVVCPR